MHARARAPACTHYCMLVDLLVRRIHRGLAAFLVVDFFRAAEWGGVAVEQNVFIAATHMGIPTSV